MKLIKKLILILAITPLMLLVSCKKLMNPEPKDLIAPENYYSTEEELQVGLTGVYDILSQNGVYGSNQSFWLVFTTDEATSRLDLRSEPIANYSYDPSNARLTNFWRQLYLGIERANILLANINKPVIDEAKRNTIKGEALFLRSYYYFLLVSGFGDVPLKLEPTSSVVNTDLKAAPSKLIYDQIIKDMTTAEGLVQDVAMYNSSGIVTDNGLKFAGRVTKSAVQGILARVCLTMAGNPVNDVSKYPLALQWAQKVKDSGRHSLNPSYPDIFVNLAQDKYDTRESIWEVEFYGNNTGGYLEGGQGTGNFIGILNNTTANSIGFSTAYVRISKKLFDNYAVNNGVSLDQRRDWNCPNFVYTADGSKTIQTNVWLYPSGKYRRELEVTLPKDRNYTPINFPLLRYSDIMLMIAEAENEVNSGPTLKTIELVNQVRRRGFGKNSIGEIVKGITVNNQGSGYTGIPTITISGGGGSGATAVAVVAGGKITTINITNPGSKYISAPTINITGTGTGATATAFISQITDADLTPVQTANKLAFLEAIQKERSLELCFEGLRKADLIRWGIFHKTMKEFAAYSDANGGTSLGAVPAKNLATKHLLYPIPSHEMSLNKSLVQNIGW